MDYQSIPKTEKETFFYRSTYHLKVEYDISDPTQEQIYTILEYMEKTYLRHAHVLCNKTSKGLNKMIKAFHSIEEFRQMLDESIIKECDEYELKRLDRSIPLYRNNEGKWCIFCSVEKRKVPDEYRYFQYHDRVIRSYTYTYELINPDTGEWEACNTNYDFEMDWDCDPIGFSEAAALIEKEQQAGEKRLFEELDIAFQQYEKPLAGQFPVFQDWLTGAGEPVALADTRDGEYYIADPYGLLITIEDSSILQEKYIFCYNIDKRGIRFWDSEPDAFLRHDLVTGQIRLFRLQKEWLRDLWPDLVEHRYRVPAQWFHFFKKRASKEEGEWLMEVVEAAIQECMDDGTRNANVPRQAAEKSFSEKLTMAAQKVRESAHSDLGEVYSMMEFRTQQAALPECLMLGILKNVIQSRAFKGDYYLIRFPESGITTEDMLEAGRRLRQRISEMKRFYPETEIKIIMAEPDKKVSEKYAIHNYYRDLEDGGLWDRTYRTTPGYSREDGWWYKKPVKIG